MQILLKLLLQNIFVGRKLVSANDEKEMRKQTKKGFQRLVYTRSYQRPILR